jgi:protein archease
VHRWVEHTAELELEVVAAREEDVFVEALRALSELLGDGDAEPAQRRVSVRASDRAALLADWLEELVFLAETEGLVPLHAADVRLGPDRLEAVVHARRGRPRSYVKAVTYHGLVFEPDGEGWRARVVLDV